MKQNVLLTPRCEVDVAERPAAAVYLVQCQRERVHVTLLTATRGRVRVTQEFRRRPQEVCTRQVRQLVRYWIMQMEE